MGLHSRDRIGENNAGGGIFRSERDAIGRTDAGARWDVSASRTASGGATPRLGALLLAVAVVALLTVGLHVLFQ
jgi:hypothetical protein